MKAGSVSLCLCAKIGIGWWRIAERELAHRGTGIRQQIGGEKEKDYKQENDLPRRTRMGADEGGDETNGALSHPKPQLPQNPLRGRNRLGEICFTQR